MTKKYIYYIPAEWLKCQADNLVVATSKKEALELHKQVIFSLKGSKGYSGTKSELEEEYSYIEDNVNKITTFRDVNSEKERLYVVSVQPSGWPNWGVSSWGLQGIVIKKEEIELFAKKHKIPKVLSNIKYSPNLNCKCLGDLIQLNTEDILLEKLKSIDAGLFPEKNFFYINIRNGRFKIDYQGNSNFWLGSKDYINKKARTMARSDMRQVQANRTYLLKTMRNFDKGNFSLD